MSAFAAVRDPSLAEMFFDEDVQLFVDDSDPRVLVWHLSHSPRAKAPVVARAYDFLPADARFEAVTVNDLDDTVDHVWRSGRP